MIKTKNITFTLSIWILFGYSSCDIQENESPQLRFESRNWNMPVYPDLYIYINIYFNFLWLSLCWMEFSDSLLISLINHRSTGAVYEHRWISQDLTLCNWFLWPGLSHTRSYWQNRDSHRGASVSKESYTRIFYQWKIYLNFIYYLQRKALRSFAGTRWGIFVVPDLQYIATWFRTELAVPQNGATRESRFDCHRGYGAQCECDEGE